MSKIKWGAIVVDGRGKLGGHVFTKTRSGATMRTKVTPVNPQTTAQAAARSRLGSQSQAWRGISEENRRGWNSLADEVIKTNIFGDNYSPSGKNLFTGLNSNLILVGSAALESPPTLVEIPVVTDLEISADSSPASLSLTVASVGDLDNTVLVVEASQMFSVGRFNFDGSYRQLYMMNVYDGSPINLLSTYTARFGALAPNTKIGFRCYFVNSKTGQASPRFAKSVVVTA